MLTDRERINFLLDEVARLQGLIDDLNAYAEVLENLLGVHLLQKPEALPGNDEHSE